MLGDDGEFNQKQMGQIHPGVRLRSAPRRITVVHVVGSQPEPGRQRSDESEHVSRQCGSTLTIDCINETCPWSGKPVQADSLALYGDDVVQPK